MGSQGDGQVVPSKRQKDTKQTEYSYQLQWPKVVLDFAIDINIDNVNYNHKDKDKGCVKDIGNDNDKGRDKDKFNEISCYDDFVTMVLKFSLTFNEMCNLAK